MSVSGSVHYLILPPTHINRHMLPFGHLDRPVIHIIMLPTSAVLCHFSVVVHAQCRKTKYTVRARDARPGLLVDLDYIHPIAECLAELLERRCHVAAVATPGCKDCES